MTTSYPSGIDTFTNPLATDTLASPAHHTQHSDANDAIEAIEAELGINPSGSYTDVVSRLADFVTNVSGTAPITSTGTATPTIALSLGSGFTGGATLTLNSSEVRTVVGTGTQNGTTYLRGDGTWATPAGGGTVTNVSGTAPIASTGGATPAISITLGSGLTGGATLTLNSGEARTILYPSGVGTVTNVSGAAPIVSTGGATPSISIDAATPSLPGSMSASDKTKLDTVTAGAKVSNVSGAAPITSTGGATPTVALALGSGFTGGATLTLNSGEARTALGTGTQNNTTYLRGDGTWATAGGTGTVTNVSGTAPINSTLGATPTISLTLGSGLQTVSNALTLASNETRAIIGTSGTPSSTTFLTGDGQWVAAGGGGAATSEPFVTIGNTAGLSAERALTAGTAVILTDAGANSTASIGLSIGAAPNALTGSPSLAGWFKADSLSLNDADAVATWADSSTNARDLAQGTAGKRPIYKASCAWLNDKPIVRFDGTDDYLTVGSLTGLASMTGWSMAFVVNSLAHPSGAGWSYWAGSDAGSDLFQMSGGTNYYLKNGGATISTSDYRTQGGNKLLVVIFNGTTDTLELWENGVLIHLSKTATGTSTQTAWFVGSSSASGEPFSGDIAEVCLYNAALTVAQRVELTRYAANKYGLPIVVPA